MFNDIYGETNKTLFNAFAGSKNLTFDFSW